VYRRRRGGRRDRVERSWLSCSEAQLILLRRRARLGITVISEDDRYLLH
jgi:hypothetical protein